MNRTSIYNAITWSNLARIKKLQGQSVLQNYLCALEIYDKCAEKANNKNWMHVTPLSGILYALGEYFEEVHDYNKAIKYYQRAVDLENVYYDQQPNFSVGCIVQKIVSCLKALGKETHIPELERYAGLTVKSTEHTTVLGRRLKSSYGPVLTLDLPCPTDKTYHPYKTYQEEDRTVHSGLSDSPSVNTTTKCRLGV